MMIDAWKQFCAENYDKCILKETYPLNMERVNELTDKISKLEYKDLDSFDEEDDDADDDEKQERKTKESAALQLAVDTLKKNIQHISFTAFMQGINAVGNGLQTKLKEKKDEYGDKMEVVLVISGSIKKSQLWVCILLSPFINEHLTHITQLLNIENSFKTNDSHKVYIHPDDMMYSGEQMTRELKQSIHTKHDNNITYILAVPFTTETAIKLVKKEFTTVFIQTYKIILTINELLDRKHHDATFILEAIVSGAYGSPTTFVYFDHKLADNLSTITELLTTGFVKVQSDKADIHVGIMIANCGEYKNKSKTFIYDYNNKDFRDEKDRCPSSFYKYIDYTLYGNRITSVHNVLMSTGPTKEHINTQIQKIYKMLDRALINDELSYFHDNDDWFPRNDTNKNLVVELINNDINNIKLKKMTKLIPHFEKLKVYVNALRISSV
jgi:hypothetical protein